MRAIRQTTFSAMLALLLSIPALFGIGLAAQVTINIGAPVVPSSIDGLARGSAAVVRGVVLANAPTVLRGPAGSQAVPGTATTVRIADILSGSDVIGRAGTVRVVRPGGFAVVDGQQVSATPVPKYLQVGGEFFFFLDREPDLQGPTSYSPRAGDSGIFSISADRANTEFPKRFQRSDVVITRGRSSIETREFETHLKQILAIKK